MNDTRNSIGLGVMSQVASVFDKLPRVMPYTLVFEQAALTRLPVGSLRVWAFALLFHDFCCYSLHCGGQRMTGLRAAHAVHHQSEGYNLGTVPNQQRRPSGSGVLHAHGAGRFAAAGVWHRGLDRPALPVLLQGRPE